MAREGGFPVSDEQVLETVERVLRAAGEAEAANLIRGGRWRFRETGYDNWNEGTTLYKLTISVEPEAFVGLAERRGTIEQSIDRALTQVVKQFNFGWYNVELAPLVVALPGRPDLEGGPVPLRIRQAIIDMLRDEGVSWQGAIDDVQFLETIFDLEALPSTDSRFTNARGDIWQHRINNEDWDEDWLYTDSRFNLLEGEDATFLMFVERLVARKVRPDQTQAAKLADRLSEALRPSGWTLSERETLTGGVRYQVEPWNPLFRWGQRGLRTAATVLSSQWMHQEIERIEASIDTDPALAIGTAKDLVETCCKAIAERLKLELPANMDLPNLVKAVLKALQLVPEDISEATRGRDTIKRTLSNLFQMPQGLAELRQLYGSGHGRAPTHRGLSARHARLASGAAAVFVEFIVATYKERASNLNRAA